MTTKQEFLTIWEPYLAGVLHGDGWCTRLTIGLRVKDKEFADLFAEAVNELYGTSLAPARDDRGYWLVRCGNKTGRFTKLKTYQPTDNDEVGCWLRGLFDSEGNAQLWLNAKMGPNSYHRRVAFYSTDMRTLATASEYLDWLGVAHSIRPTKNSASHKGTKVVYELRMVRRAGFSRFFEMVGSSIPRKHKTLAAIVSSYQPPGYQAVNWKKAIAARYPHLAGN